MPSRKLRRLLFPFLTLSGALVLPAPLVSAAPLSLDEIFQRAAARSEGLSQAQLDILRQERAVDAAKALGGSKVRLQAGLDGQQSYVEDRDPEANSQLRPNLYTEWRYPLYDGGSSRTQAETARRLVQAETWDLASQREELYLSVAQLFYNILGFKQDLKNLRESEAVYRERVATLTRREKIGRARAAEVLSARTQLQLLLSQIVAAETNMRVAEQRLLWLADMQGPLELRDELGTEQLMRLETPQRSVPLPTIEAAKARVEAAQLRREASEAASKPQLDFIASHRWSYPNDESNNTFSLGLGLNWLIYDAGQIRSTAAGLELEKQRAQLDQQLLTREASLEQNLANRAWQDGIAQLRDLERADKAAELNLKAQEREFENGLLTNLELTQALDTKLQVKRTLDQTLYRTKFAYVEAQLRAGRLRLTQAEPGPKAAGGQPPGR